MSAEDLQAALDALSRARAAVEQCQKDYEAEEKSEGDTPRDKQPKDLKAAASEARTRFKRGETAPDEQAETNFPPSKNKK